MSEPTVAAPPLLDRLGPRARRRALPRPSIALAGAGCALVVVGALVLGVEGGAGDGGDSFNRWPGLLLTAIVAAGGAVAQHLLPRGPIATAGTVAIVLAVPALLFFATLDTGDLPPYSSEAVLVLSTVTWAAAYLVGPGRGRLAFLGAAAIGLWATVLQLTENVFDFPIQALGLFAFLFLPVELTYASDGLYQSSGPVLGDVQVPDPTVAGVLSLAIGIAYVLLSRRLDQRGYAGAATPLLVAAFPALHAGLFLLAEELEPAGMGVLAVAIGAGLALHGSSVGRRATTWIGALGVVVGLVAIVLDSTSTPGVIGTLLLVLGAGLVAGAQLWSQQRGEPDEMALPGPAGPPRRTTPLRAGD